MPNEGLGSSLGGEVDAPLLIVGGAEFGGLAGDGSESLEVEELHPPAGLDIAAADEDLEASEVGESEATRMNRRSWIDWGHLWSGVKVLDAGSLGEPTLCD